MAAASERSPERIEDPGFVARWRELYEACPWATGFQHPDFVRPWFAAYADQYQPAIAADEADDGSLNGLLILARDRRAGSLHAAGAHQAEYQPWLWRSDAGDRDRAAAFFARALELLGARRLELAFLADDAPIAALQAGPLGRRLAVRLEETPLIRRQGDSKPALRGRTLKSKINRLKRLGALALEVHSQPADRRRILAWAAPRYDLRQAALFGGFPFADDPRKADFHRRLMDEAPERFQVAALTLDGEPIAAHLGVCGPRYLRLGILAHEAGLSRHSPGMVLLVFLAERILDEGLAFDLTPGDDPWKLRLANDKAPVGALTLYPSALARDAAALKSRLKSRLKSAAGPLVRRLRERPSAPAAAELAPIAVPDGLPIQDLVSLARSLAPEAQSAAASRILERLSAS